MKMKKRMIRFLAVLLVVALVTCSGAAAMAAEESAVPAAAESISPEADNENAATPPAPLTGAAAVVPSAGSATVENVTISGTVGERIMPGDVEEFDVTLTGDTVNAAYTATPGTGTTADNFYLRIMQEQDYPSSSPAHPPRRPRRLSRSPSRVVI